MHVHYGILLLRLVEDKLSYLVRRIIVYPRIARISDNIRIRLGIRRILTTKALELQIGL